MRYVHLSVFHLIYKCILYASAGTDLACLCPRGLAIFSTHTIFIVLFQGPQDLVSFLMKKSKVQELKRYICTSIYPLKLFTEEHPTPGVPES